MCDTIVSFDRVNKRSFFGKNSDREPGELQFVYISSNPREEFASQPYFEEKKEYIEHSFKTLTNIFDRFDNGYKAILSRPVWMWGAEMGVNEYGLSIGNEAVFSKEKLQRDGLLGMDMLRLALHNNKSAEEAVDFIINLIAEVGQGGDGGYKSSLKYHNSFLIKDFDNAYVLETSGKHWAYKKVDKCASISNAYSIRDDFDKSDSDASYNFKQQYQDKLFSFFSKGDTRQRASSSNLLKSSSSLKDIKDILRFHHKGSIPPVKGMKSNCLHTGSLIKSETTSSMIVDYIGDKFIVWFTDGPHPCVSIYKPMVISYEGEDFNNIEKSMEYSKKVNAKAKEMVDKYENFISNIKPTRDELEDKFEEIIYSNIGSKSYVDITQDIDECLLKCKP
ncbi:MAG: dipeptidase [Clostridiales bacterium]|jgi:hypothetical protein|nr:dipeptidase [Clostridiales bacterium]